jgi:hypothetical protein
MARFLTNSEWHKSETLACPTMNAFVTRCSHLVPRIIFFAFLFVYTHSYCQRQITGKVTDSETKKGIKDALIFTGQSANGNVTNALGFFRITIDTAKYLTIKCSGYQPARIKVPDVNTFQIALTKIKSDERSGKIVDAAFIKRATEILKKNNAIILYDFPKYPYPWSEIGNEKENLRNNKVKKIKNSSFESEFDKNGETLFHRIYERRQSVLQMKSAGTVEEYARKENGEILEQIYINLAFPNVVHKRDFRSAGDTLYVRWSANDSIMGVGLMYKNIFVDKDIKKNTFTLYIFGREKLPTGFSYSEKTISDNNKQAIERNKFILSNNQNLVEHSNSYQNEKYFFDSANLIKERQVFVKGELVQKDLYIRDNRGLITELVEQESPFRKDKAKFENRIKYEYEFYD